MEYIRGDFMKEIWEDINGYEGMYQVSSLGRVKGLRRFRKTSHLNGANNGYTQKEAIKSQKKLKPNKTKNLSSCYLQVTLCKDGKPKLFSIHRLVAEAFIPNQENKPYVNHIDGNRENNIVSNLEWTTNRENQMHAVFEIKNGLNAKSVIALNKKTNIKELEFTSMTEASKWLLKSNKTKDITCLTGIIKCCKGRIPSYLGYLWRYKDEVKNNANEN
jgi:hypothetical protein